jgi:hypothetical protein
MFDMKKFMSTKFKERTQDIPLPDLAAWFPPEVPPVFTVRGLTGEELGRVNESAAKNKNVAGLLDALASSNVSEKIDALKESLGLSQNVPDDIAKRIEQLVLGLVEPKFDLQAAVKFFQVYPVEGYQLTNAIMRLTGQGQLPGESQPSGVETT